MPVMDEFFKTVSPIQYEGPQSENPLAFKYYNPDQRVGVKTMKEHLRFSIAYWHTFMGTGTDPFGAATMVRPWDDIRDPMDQAKARMRAAFEFFQKLGVEYFCFHDRDIAPEAGTLARTNRNLDEMVALAKTLMAESGVKLLWGTANLFSHPRYMHGAATTCNADVFAFAAAQVKKALEITCELGGSGYVFWGGREGYETLLNTDLGLELDNLARFMRMAVEYAQQIGFKGQFYIEPKPKEPTKHQYDFDCANSLAFLRQHGLDAHFKFNVETNHATLAGHTMQHELRYARVNGMLGSVDANQGDLLLGWDTDQFPTNLYVTTLAMYEILKMGGFTTGGLNFDAHVRRASFQVEDLFYAHIAGMDAFARGLQVAYKLIEDGVLEAFIDKKYASFGEGIGADIVAGRVGLAELEQYALEHDQIVNSSGRQEMLEAILNRYLLETR